MALPPLIGAVLTRVPGPERAGAAAGSLASHPAVRCRTAASRSSSAIYYGVLGTAPARGTFVSGMVVAMTVSAALVAAAAAATLLLPRRTAARHAAGRAVPLRSGNRSPRPPTDNLPPQASDGAYALRDASRRAYAQYFQ